MTKTVSKEERVRLETEIGRRFAVAIEDIERMYVSDRRAIESTKAKALKECEVGMDELENWKREESAKATVERDRALAELPPLEKTVDLATEVSKEFGKWSVVWSYSENKHVVISNDQVNARFKLISEAIEACEGMNEQQSPNGRMSEAWSILADLQAVQSPTAYEKGYVGFQQTVTELVKRARKLFLDRAING